MTLTVEIDPARRTAAFREVSFLAAGDSCRVVLDGVRGADFWSLALLLYRDAASESPVASCPSFSPVDGHPALADGELALDTTEMAAWFADAVPEESDDSDDAALPRASASAEPRLAARASLAERSVRADGWLVVLDRDRTWAACRVPVLLRPGAGGHGASDPTSVRALVEGLVSAALADKADKASPAVAGNLASLDASGNLVDSGATPASIKAAAVAEVVNGADATMDTLKEIADILGSNQASGSVLKRILDLESGKVNKEAGKGLVAVDATLTTSGAAADAKAVGDALAEKLDGAAAYPAWDAGIAAYLEGLVVSWHGRLWRAKDDILDLVGPPDGDGAAYWEEKTIAELKQDALSQSQLAAVNSGATATKVTTWDGYAAQIVGKADKVAGATAGDLASLDSSGNLADSGAKPSDFAAKADLPYRLVEPGKWEFSDGGSFDISGPIEDNGTWYYTAGVYLSNVFDSESEAVAALTLTFTDPSGQSDPFTATRASLPGHLLDRAGNRVEVTGDTTLTLPAAVAGYARDFLVRLEISGSTVPTITFAAPTGETIVYETDGDEFPVPDEVGNWVYSFTENCVSHTFAVSLKKVNVVAQGGS